MNFARGSDLRVFSVSRIGRGFSEVERVARVELASLAWEARVIPIYDTRNGVKYATVIQAETTFAVLGFYASKSGCATINLCGLPSL